MPEILPSTEHLANGDNLPRPARIATALQALMTCVAIFVWGAWATWGRFPYSLEASTVVFGLPLSLCFAATIGLWKGKMFGWVTGILGNALMAALLCFTLFPACLLPASLLAFLLSPRIREFYVRNYYE